MKIAIYGYGNLGKGVECAVKQNPDVELVAVFTRRNPESLKINTDTAKVVHVSEIDSYVDKIDVLVICGGSATDLPEMTPSLAKKFCVIDSFDTHADIPTHFSRVDKSAREGGKLAMISAGWDPGMFSLNRVYADAILPCGKEYTFWGKGVSQGHSDAIRRIDGVLDARQYTCPVESVVDRVRRGETPDLTTREKHTRLCYVVAKEGADLERIERERRANLHRRGFLPSHRTKNGRDKVPFRRKESGVCRARQYLLRLHLPSIRIRHKRKAHRVPPHR